MKVKTSKLTGHALAWASAVAASDPPKPNAIAWRLVTTGQWKPHEDWAQGGPIIERERIGLSWVESNWRYMDGCWSGVCTGQIRYAPTPLVAAMRCFVASKLGDEVDVPEELMA